MTARLFAAAGQWIFRPVVWTLATLADQRPGSELVPDPDPAAVAREAPIDVTIRGEAGASFCCWPAAWKTRTRCSFRRRLVIEEVLSWGWR